MSIIDQHSVISSMEATLLSDLPLIDSRTETDWLHQLTKIASLINYYNNENKVSGNWQPFLLKDPVFLLASISKTDFEKYQQSYTDVCRQLELHIRTETFSSPVVAEGFNQLFDLLVHIFNCIRQWIFYMQFTGYDYPLKTYTIQQVKTVFSKYLWAVISMKDALFIAYLQDGIAAVDPGQLYLFNHSDDTIWKINKDKEPYWDVLGIKYPVKGKTPLIGPAAITPPIEIIPNDETLVFNGLKKAGNELMAFFHTIIRNAGAGLKEIRALKSSYPDTVLLRSFINILKIHQDQLNGITKKYFHFYYNDILKQKKLPAVADKVFTCVVLAKKDAAFDLPPGTLFDAGVDSLNKPILFTSTENVSLNPATIASVCTMAVSTDINNRSTISLQYISNANKVTVDNNGKTLSWPTFGGAGNDPAVNVKQAISFASPVLLLREGIRRIKLILNFAGEALSEFTETTSFYLSTAKGWLQVIPKYDTAKVIVASMVVVYFDLDPSQPPIEPLIKNANGLDVDGLNTAWPMIKIEFDSFTNISNPPVINSVRIEVSASGIKTLQLYNDYGLLDSKSAYQPFGPAPLLNSNFIIGSNEIFSKPLSLVLMELDWNNLPDDFLNYYKAYNENLPAPESIKDNNSYTLKTIFSETANRVRNFFKHFWAMIVAFFWKEVEGTVDVHANIFNNYSFTVDFEILQNRKWIAADRTIKSNSFPADNIDLTWQPFVQGSACSSNNDDFSDQLFTTVFDTGKKKCLLAPSSFFAYDPVAALQPDPTIQLDALKFTGDNSCGFVKMSLSGPDVGFGSTVYPVLVSEIALKNAWLLMHPGFFEDPDFKKPANLPFIPKMTGMSMHYSASVEYSFSDPTKDYPLQCYLYTAFNNYKLYDSLDLKALPGLSLFNAFPYKGCVFIGLQNLVPSNDIDIYFELSAKSGASTAGSKLVYRYLSLEGWKELPVLSDGTFQFTCSGIIRVHVPADIIDTAGTMAANNYWIQVAINNDAGVTVNNSPASFPQTVFLNTNGLLLQRSETTPAPPGEQPVIVSLSIQKCKTVVPQLSSVLQPFPSFGGKVQENEPMMNRRVGSLIKTKGRAVTAEDFHRLIRQEFNDIYYSRLITDNNLKRINVLVARACKNIADPNAFIPLASGYLLESIQEFLTDSAPAFFAIVVSNFELLYIEISAQVTVKTGNNIPAMQKNINDALNIYLSPWIAGASEHVSIEEGISESQLTGFIKSIEGVVAVKQLSLLMWKYGGDKIPVLIPGEENLLVSCMEHDIKCFADNG